LEVFKVTITINLMDFNNLMPLPGQTGSKVEEKMKNGWRP
jgi:hypothetical protein